MGVLHTPDYFVIRENEAGWEEWKTEEDLRRLSERNANRYSAGEDGRCRCAPGTAYAERLGLYYRVRSSAEIDWRFQRNIQFLEDYLRVDSPAFPESSREIAVAYVLATPGLPLKDLLELTKGTISPDDIFAMIAAQVLYVDLRAAPLAEPSIVNVFPTPEAASMVRKDGALTGQVFSSGALHCGSTITWDGRIWKLVNAGETAVGLLSDDQRLTELPIAAFEALIRHGRIAATPAGIERGGEAAGRLSTSLSPGPWRR